MSAPAEASATGEALVQVGSAGIAASPRVSGEESSPQHPSQQAQPERELGSLCSSLAAAAAAANNDLREYLLQHADQRPSIVGLSRELVEVQTASRLYIRRCSVVDASAEDNAADSLPTRVIAHLITVVHETGRVVANIMNVLEASGMENGQGSAGAAADLAPRLSRATASTNICTAALNLGLDAMALASSLQPTPEETQAPELPGYQTTQLLQDTLSLRVRLTNLNEGDSSEAPNVVPPVSQFLDQLQGHLEQGSNSLLVPAITESGSDPLLARSDASSLQSDVQNSNGNLLAVPNESALPGQQSPAYDSVHIEHPAPGSISMNHVSRKPGMEGEIYDIAFVTIKGQPHITANTMNGSTKFLPIQGSNTVVSTYNGGSKTFPPEGSLSSTWAYVTEDDMASSNAAASHWQHDGSDFRKPVLHVGDYLTNKRHQKLRSWAIRPLAFSPDGQRLAVTNGMHRIAMLDAANQFGLRPDEGLVTTHTDVVTHAVFTPDSHALVSASRDGTVRLTDPFNLEPLGKLDTGTWKKPALLGVTPDSNVVVSVWGDLVYRWNHVTGAVDSYALGSRRAREGWPVALSPDCRFLLCRNESGVDISDAHSGRVLFTVRFNRGFLTAGAFSADSRFVALGKAAGTVGLKTHQSTVDVWQLEF